MADDVGQRLVEGLRAGDFWTVQATSNLAQTPNSKPEQKGNC